MRKGLNPCNTPQGSAESWPNKVPAALVKKCCNSYRKRTIWKKPVCCAICGHQKHGIGISTYTLKDSKASMPTRFNCLKVQTGSHFDGTKHFQYGHNGIDGMMLCPNGIQQVNVNENKGFMIHLCDLCDSSLTCQKLPKYALANNLFVGNLPDELGDLTWVEEQVCTLHRSTVFVYRLYG